MMIIKLTRYNVVPEVRTPVFVTVDYITRMERLDDVVTMVRILPNSSLEVVETPEEILQKIAEGTKWNI